MTSRSSARRRTVAALATTALATLAQAQQVGSVVPSGPLPAIGPGAFPNPVDLRQHYSLFGVTEDSSIVQFDTVLGRFNAVMTPATSGQSNAITINNFLSYVTAARYDNTIIHRSVRNFVIQGGGFTSGGPFAVNQFIPSDVVATFSPIVLEYNLPNVRGSLSMARTDQLNSATSQFFINTVDNTQNLGPSNGGGYAVFASVLGTGMSVVDAIAAINIYNAGNPFAEIPLRNFPANPPFPAVTAANLVTINTVRNARIYPSASAAPTVLTFSTSSSNTELALPALRNASLYPGIRLGRTGTATITVTATDTNGNAFPLSQTVDLPTPFPDATLANISTRGRIEAGDRVLIAGFVVLGSGPKRILIRALGPALESVAPSLDTVANPRVSLFRGSQLLLSNDDWGTNANAADITSVGNAVGAAPALAQGSLDAALLTDLTPGAYTVIVEGAGDPSEGLGLVEVYEADRDLATAKAVNISTRAMVRLGNDIAIAGFVVYRRGTYLVRGIGDLAGIEPEAELANPRISLFRGQTLVADNDNWETSNVPPADLTAAATAAGASPLTRPSDAALLVTLDPGIYSLHLASADNETGIALIEVNEVP